MGTKVTVRSSSPNRISINNQQPKTVRTVAVQPVQTTNFLATLDDVDSSGAENNETVVYDSVTQKYVVKPLPVVDGGTF
jgi:hypothetical protein